MTSAADRYLAETKAAANASVNAARAAVERYTEAAFALAVVGAALIYPPAALLVGAAFLVALAAIADKRSPTE